jgi:hypothetical protein
MQRNYLPETIYVLFLSVKIQMLFVDDWTAQDKNTFRNYHSGVLLQTFLDILKFIYGMTLHKHRKFACWHLVDFSLYKMLPLTASQMICSLRQIVRWNRRVNERDGLIKEAVSFDIIKFLR